MTIIHSDELLRHQQRLEEIQALGSRLPRTGLTLTWQGLSDAAETFAWEPSASTLSALLERWESYWKWAWANSPPPLAWLIELWQEVIERMELKVSRPDQIIRFPDTLAIIRTVAAADPQDLFTGKVPLPHLRFPRDLRGSDLSLAVSLGLFPGEFIRVVNAGLCFLNVREGLIQKTPGARPEEVRGGIEMMLTNRMMLAFEWFSLKLIHHNDDKWEDLNVSPPVYEVLVDRVQRVLQRYRCFEPE